MRVGHRVHLRLHRVRGQIDENITTAAAIKKMHMRIVWQHPRNGIVWRAVGGDRAADEFGGDNGRSFVVKIKLQIVGEERMNVAGNDDRVGNFGVVDVLQETGAIGRLAVPIVSPKRIDAVLFSAQLRH